MSSLHKHFGWPGDNELLPRGALERSDSKSSRTLGHEVVTIGKKSFFARPLLLMQTSTEEGKDVFMNNSLLILFYDSSALLPRRLTVCYFPDCWFLLTFPMFSLMKINFLG